MEALIPVAGISQIFVVISLQNAVGLISTPEMRDHRFGWYSFTTSCGQFVGPACAGLVADTSDTVTVFLLSAAIALVPVFIGWLFLSPQVHTKVNKVNSTQVTNEFPKKKNKPISSLQFLAIKGMHQSIIASMLIQFSRDIIYTYFPLYAQGQGISTTGIVYKPDIFRIYRLKHGN